MTLAHILIFSFVAILISWLVPAKWRTNALLFISILSIYWLQPASTIRNLDFWLPTTAIILTVITWLASQKHTDSIIKAISPAITIMVFIIFGLSISRFFEPLCCLTPSKPPQLSSILIYLLFASFLFWIIYRIKFIRTHIIHALLLLIIALLIIQKSPTLAEYTSAFLRKTTVQDTSLASALDISWLGFSYLAFRLLHVLQDSKTGKYEDQSLGNFATYALFFPTYTAGPIDRSQRFNNDLQAIKSYDSDSSFLERFSNFAKSADFLNGSKRIFTGIFKKFVLADSLALIAINKYNASQINESLWVWVLIYAFSLQIYLDFSGYTDVALGIGTLLGFKIPENFTQPYRKTNLTTFWNSWHITLSQWFRAYFFNPLTRWLRSHPGQIPVWVIILSAQLGTMLLIGLWHGISWNFAIWGLWHGVGLFIHNRWADWTRSLPKLLPKTQSAGMIRNFLGWFITFHYVSLGWVWFALSDPVQSLSVFQKLFSF